MKRTTNHLKMPENPPKSCGKNRYSSKAEAENVATEQELLFANHDLKLKVYLCSSCGGWHLTKSNSK